MEKRLFYCLYIIKNFIFCIRKLTDVKISPLLYLTRMSYNKENSYPIQDQIIEETLPVLSVDGNFKGRLHNLLYLQ